MTSLIKAGIMKKLFKYILAASLFYTIFNVTADILLGTDIKDKWDKVAYMAKKKYEELKSKDNDGEDE